jgi:hypothetical protein
MSDKKLAPTVEMVVDALLDVVSRVRAALDGPEPPASVYGIGTRNSGPGGVFVGKSDGGVMGT